jgi:DNA repair protein RecO (recombination protein O)
VPNRERTYRTEAIILRRKDMGEADRVLTLLTPERGKLRAIAKGIRKPRSRKAGHLELFTRSSLLLAVGRELDVITQAQTVDAHRPLREYLIRGAYAAYSVELMDKFTPEQQGSRELYRLLRDMLSWLSLGENLAQTARYYELRLLGLAGFQPQLHHCVIGGEKIVAEDQYFSATEGGAVCAKCAKRILSGAAGGRTGLLPISTEALKCLRHFQTQPHAKIANLRLRPAALQEMEYVLQRYITVLLERQLKSVEFLKLIRREAAA